MTKINVVQRRMKMIKLGKILLVISQFAIMLLLVGQLYLIFECIQHYKTAEVNRYASLNAYFLLHLLSIIITIGIAGMSKGIIYGAKKVFGGLGQTVTMLATAPVIASCLIFIASFSFLNYKKTRYFLKSIKLADKEWRK